MMGRKGKPGERPQMPKMSDEDKAAAIEELKAELAKKLEACEISQEEYDKATSKLDEGKLPIRGGRGMHRRQTL